MLFSITGRVPQFPLTMQSKGSSVSKYTNRFLGGKKALKLFLAFQHVTSTMLYCGYKIVVHIKLGVQMINCTLKKHEGGYCLT